MKEQDSSRAIAFSGVLGVGLFVVGTHLMLSSYPEQDVVGMMCGLGLLIVGGRWLAPLLAGAIAEPAGRIFYPGDKLDKPSPSYSLAQAHRSFERYEEAVQALLEVVGSHPQEFQAWREILELTLLELQDEPRARGYLQQALRACEDPAQRTRLQQSWADIRERATRAGSNVQETPTHFELPE